MALSDYLASRRAEIEAQIKALRAELTEIRIAEDALAGATPTRAAVASATGPATVRTGSIKDWVLKALMHEPEGLETDAVIFKVREIGGPEVSRNSMTPQLSRLKAARLIGQEGRLWRLPSKTEPQNDETPDGYQPSGASEHEEVDDDLVG